MSKLDIKVIKQPDRLINYWIKEKYIVLCIIIFGISFNVSMIFGPIYQGKLIDSMVNASSLHSILILAAVYILLIAMTQILRYFKRFYIRRFANSTSATMRRMLYNSILHKELPELLKENTGDLMSRAVSDVELCVEGMRKFTTEIFDTGVLMLSYLITLLVYDPGITLLSVMFVPVAMLLAEKLKVLIYRYSIAFRKKNSDITGLTYDLIENTMLYRVSGMDEVNLDDYLTELSDFQKKAVKANILENSMQPVYNVIAMAGCLIVIYLGGRKVIDGGWTIGMFSTFITIFIAMAGKASKASKLFNSVQKSQVSWRRIKPYLAEYQMDNEESRDDNNTTELTVDDLGFSYREGGEPVIRNISFHGTPGEIIGVTGPVASGKSTLGAVLTGLYPYLGSIRINDKELKDYSELERSRLISYLGHRSELMSDTVYQNITLGEALDITEVLQDVRFEEDLEGMPEGIETIVGSSGMRLSGGQQARIALARALVRKTRLIILDDPFSAVDMNTEVEIIQKLKLHYKNSIIILISHRLAIFPELNRILLMHSDHTVECGSHEELMVCSEIYETIYRLQTMEGGGTNE